MANTAHGLVTKLAFAAALFSGPQADAEERQARLILHLDNYGLLRRAERAAAETEVTRIYAQAGVLIVWAAGPGSADIPGMHLHVRFLSSDRLARRKIAAERVADDVLGLALREAGRAYIFIHRLAAWSLQHRGDFGRVLGRVIAHEVGHLVLPMYSHSEDGIMRARLVVRAKSSQEFTPQQAFAIRSLLLTTSRSHAAQITDAALAR